MVLSTDSGELTSSDQEAVELLGKYFAEMFTSEAGGVVPSAEVKDLGWEDNTIDLSKEAVLKKLHNLPTDKAPGPDKIHPLI